MVYEIKDGKGNIIVFYQGEKIFEGEYLYGIKWNGKGKESHDGKIEFEGEYLNGKKWNGKIKEYYDIGKIKSEGEYLNGKRNGEWKIYSIKGKLFKIEYSNGKKNGKGKELYDNDELKFEG